MVSANPSNNYALIRQAIVDKHQVIAVYRGRARELCPHAIGAGPNGYASALFYQFGGDSEKGLGADGSPDNWRCMDVGSLRNVIVRPGDWHTCERHTTKSTCIKVLDIEVVP